VYSIQHYVIKIVSYSIQHYVIKFVSYPIQHYVIKFVSYSIQHYVIKFVSYSIQHYVIKFVSYSIQHYVIKFVSYSIQHYVIKFVSYLRQIGGFLQVLDTTTLCDKVCQLLATGRWFSPGPPVSSANKTDRHDIIEILFKMVLNTITITVTMVI
jgi:hypothetical protein